MSHAKRALWMAGTGLLLAATACGMASAAGFSDDEGGPRASNSQDGGGKNDDPENSSTGAPGAPTATGVILLHAASFPSFRLCFSNFPDLVPQPDSKVMPEANVVGVDIGSLVRIDPLKAPGTVYVINESEVRLAPGTANPPKCEELLREPGKKTPRSLTKDNDYHVATVIDTPLGQNKVSVLAITGCGSQAFLNDIGASNTNCGASWNVTTGNLQAKVVDLGTTATGATKTRLPVQLFHMSPALEAFKGAGGSLQVTFGALQDGGAPLAQPVAAGALFEGGAQTSLDVDQSEMSAYGAYGFRITASSPGGTFDASQSLAAVQELSAPRELPTSYYRAASNYALLLLGDPTHKATLENGDPNPGFNPRQAVHLLAVPVLDPAKADAGDVADATPTPAGDGGT